MEVTTKEILMELSTKRDVPSGLSTAKPKTSQAKSEVIT